MGPPATTTPATRDASGTTSASLSRRSQAASARSAAATDHVEWASPTSIRARSRPSNLHSYLRVNAAPSPRPLRSRSASSSGGSVASPKPARSHRVRSQSTRATQTIPTDFLRDTSADASLSISLGEYGAIRHMTMDTVDYLMHALEERRRVLLRDERTLHRASDASSSASEPQMEPTVAESTRTETSMDARTTHDDDDTVEHKRASPTSSSSSSRRVRSRSYEALAKLEQILEARHQQLMQAGALDGPTVLSLHEPPGSDLTQEIRKLQQSFLLEARGQR